MINYLDYSKKTRSRKIILAKINSIKLHKLFEIYSPNIYKRTLNNFVYKVLIDGIELIEVNNSSLNNGEFYYNAVSGELFIRTFDGSNPSSHECLIGFTHFFSNIPVNLNHDFNNGEIVHWDARIKNTGELKLEIDYEQTGIALESDSNIALENNDGFFDDIFDTHIFDNQDVKIYSWHESLLPTEVKLIYRGKVKDKSFTSQEVRFNLRDQIKDLRKVIETPLFSSLDGNISDSILNKPKRLILGKAKQIKTEGLDKVLDGYELTGTISGDADRNLMSGIVSGVSGSSVISGFNTLFLTEINPGDKIKVIGPFNEYQYEVLSITNNTELIITSTISVGFSIFQARNLSILNNILEGVGTNFLNEVLPDDTLRITINDTDYRYRVESVNSATNITLSDEVQVSFGNKKMNNEPSVPYRKKNRVWSIAGHKLREFQSQITTIENDLNIEVNSIGDLEEGDLITINGEPRYINNISGLKIRLNQVLPNTVVVGDYIVRAPVPNVYFGKERLIINRDYTINNASESKIILNDLAEFNIAKIQSPVISFQFVNGSNIVNSVASTIDLTTILSPRDWIRSKDISLTNWYEIKKVNQTSIELINNWSEPSITSLSYKKSPDFVVDDSLITCDCSGLESSGEWIKKPSQAVKWLLGQASITNINNASFSLASDVANFTLSAIYPENIGQDMPQIRDVISSINESIFGSLYLDKDFNFTFQILNAERPLEMEEIKDDDIISFQVNTRNNIVSIAQVNYKKFTDLSSGELLNNTYKTQSQFTQNTSGNFETISRDLLLYEESDAQLMAQRLLFFRSLSQTLITIDAKLNLALSSLNDRVFLSLQRLFKRFGGNDKRRIGIINSIYKDGYGVKATFNDLGNIFNRVGVIAPNTQANYSSSKDSDIVRWAFIVDNELEVPDVTSEKELGNNLIG